MDLLYPTLDTVLKAQEEEPSSLIFKDGRVYIDVELLTSLVDLTIHRNMDEHPGNMMVMACMAAIATTMKFAPELLMYERFNNELAEL